MSARPALALLPPEELDLLISRSLDGDLSPEEREELERHLASDAAARQRRDELAAMVHAVRELPAPEPPFALATRVVAQVSERAQGTSAAWNRLGIYPLPGVLPAAAVLLGVAALVATFSGGRRPQPVPAPTPVPDHAAPVQVFFQESAPAIRWTVSVVGENPAWRLVGTPVTRPEGAVDATFRLTLDAAGRVSSLRPLSPGATVRSDVTQLLRGLVFEPVRPASAPREVDVRILAR